MERTVVLESLDGNGCLNRLIHAMLAYSVCGHISCCEGEDLRCWLRKAEQRECSTPPKPWPSCIGPGRQMPAIHNQPAVERRLRRQCSAGSCWYWHMATQYAPLRSEPEHLLYSIEVAAFGAESAGICRGSRLLGSDTRPGNTARCLQGGRSGERNGDRRREQTT